MRASAGRCKGGRNLSTHKTGFANPTYDQAPLHGEDAIDRYEKILVERFGNGS
jgi:hypothetical protein